MSQHLIRNFAIIAHVDHGKTTLTDQLLKITGTISDRQATDRLLDSNPIEKERGITIKLAPVTMEYAWQGQTYQLNLIDTPGHVDFSYEVSRSLQACEGAVLLIDATQGIQAQTMANYYKAQELGLAIIPVLNKVDLPMSDVEAVTLECMETFGVEESDILHVSAKTGQGVAELLAKVIAQVPAPTGQVDAPLRALVFSSFFDQHQGVVASVRVVDGQIKARQKLRLLAANQDFEPIEQGIFVPFQKKNAILQTGEVGFVATGLKEPAVVKTGDTLTLSNQAATTQLPGYREPTPMVYQQLYPIAGDDFADLVKAMDKLRLHDSSLQVTPTNSEALGNGLQVGFLGMLHAEVVAERLRREFDLDLIATAPSVEYHVETTAGHEVIVTSPAELPDPSQIKELKEPIVLAKIFTPHTTVGAVMQLCQDHRGKLVSMHQYGQRQYLEYHLPLAEIVTEFYGQLKSVSSGYASLEYQVVEYNPVDAVKVSVLVNKEEVEALSFIVVKEKAEARGRRVVELLKEAIPRQLFEIPVQAAIGGSVIARATIKAFRKDVTAKLYGGDRTRRMKLLAKQAKGKKRMKQVGSVELSPETFLAVLKQ